FLFEDRVCYFGARSGLCSRVLRERDTSQRPMRLFDEQLTRAALMRRIGRLDQAAGVRLVTLGDGTERGVRLLEFRTGTGFEFDVVVDRAFDIGRCEHAGRALGWQSAVGFAEPWFYEEDGLGFLRNFGGGLLTTCGLNHTLF